MRWAPPPAAPWLLCCHFTYSYRCADQVAIRLAPCPKQSSRCDQAWLHVWKAPPALWQHAQTARGFLKLIWLTQCVLYCVLLCLQRICVQIMGVPPDVYKDVGKALAWPWPPTLFVHMPRDQLTAAAVDADAAALKAEVRWRLNSLP